MSENQEVDIIDEVISQDYKYGFSTDIEMETAPMGLSEEIVRFISAKKNEPEWLLEWRLKAYRYWLTLEEPTWQNFSYPKVNYQDIIFYAAPKQKITLDSLDQVDPELLKTFEKLGISLTEQKRLTGVAVDAVFDSVSIATTFKDQLKEILLRADQIQFSDEELGPIVQFVNVSAKNQRYSLETQVNDLLDELLSTIPTIDRTPSMLNSVHVMIQRFKQLRQLFSTFDTYGNIEDKLVKEANYKPLVKYFEDFDTILYWIVPIVKNVKKVYDVENVDDNDTLEYLQLNTDIQNMKAILDTYRANGMPEDQNAYATLFRELNGFFRIR
jgi:hypothetical protein